MRTPIGMRNRTFTLYRQTLQLDEGLTLLPFFGDFASHVNNLAALSRGACRTMTDRARFVDIEAQLLR